MKKIVHCFLSCFVFQFFNFFIYFILFRSIEYVSQLLTFPPSHNFYFFGSIFQILISNFFSFFCRGVLSWCVKNLKKNCPLISAFLFFLMCGNTLKKKIIIYRKEDKVFLFLFTLKIHDKIIRFVLRKVVIFFEKNQFSFSLCYSYYCRRKLLNANN